MSLTAADIEARNYTYVTICTRTAEGKLNFEAFLVSSRFKTEAVELAQRYILQHGLVIEPWNDGKDFNLYPRNYVKKARLLYSEGKFL